MKVREIANILQAKVLTCADQVDTVDVYTVCGSDMMSDVLAFSSPSGMLLTGLCNPQVVRTAEMMDKVCVAFVRGKTPDELSIKLATDRGIILLSTDMRMFHACGKLYVAGLNTEETE